MPDPISQFASDRIIYDYICYPLSKHICFVPPNAITFLCFLCIIPIMYNIYKNGPILPLIAWVALRGILDCLDGALARKCETISPLGAKLDIINDTVALIAVVAVVFIKLIGTKYYFVLIFPLILVFRLIQTSFYTLSGRDVVRDHPIIKYFHDNTVINAIVFCYITSLWLESSEKRINKNN